MKIYSGLDNLEINVPKKYYAYKEAEEYRVYSDSDNPDAFDANFAVLKSGENIDESVKQVEIFHEAANAIPLFVSAPDSITQHEAKGLLQPRGYSFCAESLTIMQAIPRPSYKDIMPISCDVRTPAQLCEPERELMRLQSNNMEYLALMTDRKLAAGAKLFVAYNAEKEPVSCCVCESYGEALYVSCVYTRENSRKRGFARAVMCSALQHAFERSYAAVYVYLTDIKAYTLYEKLGFKESGKITAWKAFKGELPEWIIKNIKKDV